MLDRLTALELFNLVPVECAVGRRLGFYVELTTALLMPLISMLVLFLLAVAVLPFRFSLNRRGRGLVRTLLEWPQVWDLAVWLLLLQFSVVGRKVHRGLTPGPHPP